MQQPIARRVPRARPTFRRLRRRSRPLFTWCARAARRFCWSPKLALRFAPAFAHTSLATSHRVRGSIGSVSLSTIEGVIDEHAHRDRAVVVSRRLCGARTAPQAPLALRVKQAHRARPERRERGSKRRRQARREHRERRARRERREQPARRAHRERREQPARQALRERRAQTARRAHQAPRAMPDCRVSAATKWWRRRARKCLRAHARVEDARMPVSRRDPQRRRHGLARRRMHRPCRPRAPYGVRPQLLTGTVCGSATSCSSIRGPGIGMSR